MGQNSSFFVKLAMKAPTRWSFGGLSGGGCLYYALTSEETYPSLRLGCGRTCLAPVSKYL